MKKTFVSALRPLVVLVMLGAMLGARAVAPEVRMYYPGQSDPPQELQRGAKTYIYFVAGTKAIEAVANLVQEGQKIGTVTYTAKTPTTTLTMDPKSDANADLDKIQPGNVTFEFFKVRYLDADGNEVLHEDEANPYGSVTYLRKGEYGKIVSESGFEDGLIKSYYPAGSESGVKTFVFDKQVLPDKIHAYFVYGNSNMSNDTSIPWTLSEDGLTLTLDMRGRCYNPDVLAPGQKFVDDNGNPTDPPGVITLEISGLNCADGTKIVSVVVDGAHSTTLTGRIFQVYKYEDITLPNPVIAGVEFFSKDNPSEKSASITETTDMMSIKVTNAHVIVSAEMGLDFDTVSETIAWNDIEVNDEIFTVAIPESIRKTGSDRLIITLNNVSYIEDDGATHVIRPLNMAYLTREVASVAELKALEPGTMVTLKIPSGLKITLSNDQGYTFGEDEKDGLQLVTADYSCVFTEEMVVRGSIAGQYQGGGMFMVDPDASSYTETYKDMSTGKQIDFLNTLVNGEYDFRLVTFVANKVMSIDVEDGMIVIGNELVAVTDMVDFYVAPETVENVTGVYYNAPGMGKFLLVRRMADFNQEGLVPADPQGVAAVVVDGNKAAEGVYDLNGRLVRASGNDLNGLAKGVYIVDGNKVLVGEN